MTGGFIPWLAALPAGAPPPPGDLAAFGNAWIIGLAYLVLVGLGFVVAAGLLAAALRRPDRWTPAPDFLAQRAWPLAAVSRLMIWLLVLHGAGLTLNLLAMEAGLWPGLDETTVAVIVQSLVFHGAGLVLVLALLRPQRVPWRRMLGAPDPAPLRATVQGLLFYLGTLPFLLVGSLVYQLLLRQLGVDVNLQDVAWAVSGDQPAAAALYLGLFTVVVAPLFEEVLFRGILLPMVAARTGLVVAMTLVSLLFAGLHFHLPSLAPLFIISMAFSLGYAISGSLVTAFVMHALFNGINLALLYILRSG